MGSDSPESPRRQSLGKRRVVEALSDDEDEVVQKRSRPASLQDEEDALDALDGLSSDQDQSPRIVKREIMVNGHARQNGHAQANGNGHAGSEEESGLSEDEEVDPNSRPRRDPGYKRSYDRGDDGFVAGSVVRIRMVNFMTYDYVEFRPGPHLNMILGPNGTGKSSIAACIAIGLGFQPGIMGRAKDIKSYVKQGAEEAETEIELKGKRGKRNPVIWRKFNRESEASDFKINGQTATKKAVRDIVDEAGIQASNLCSFLPQDRVAEFAKMDPKTVLRETISAAGDPRMTRWHAKLCEKGEKRLKLETELAGHTGRREQLRVQVDTLAPDVEHVQNRQEKEYEKEILEIMVPCAVNVETDKKMRERKAERLQLKQALQAANSKSQPLIDLREKLGRKQTKARVRVDAADTDLKTFHKDAKSAGTRVERAVQNGENVDRELQTLKQRMQRREAEKQRHRDRIRECQELLDSTTVAALVKATQEKLDAKKQAVARVRAEGEKVKELQDAFREQEKIIADRDERLKLLVKRQQQLSSVEKQREQAARDFDPSISFLLDWLERHGHELEAPVSKPPMISVNVRHQKYAWQIEMATSLAVRKTFICQSQSDYARLVSLNGTPYPAGVASNGRPYQEGKVALHLTCLEVTEENLNPTRPCSVQTLNALGFDGWAIDFVDADNAVTAFLNQNARMYSTAITQRPTTDIDTEAVTKAGILTWGTRDDWNRAVRSAYGRREIQLSTSQPVAARAFNKVVDTEAVEQVSQAIADLKRQQRDIEEPHQKLRKQCDEAHKRAKDLEKEAAIKDEEFREVKSRGGKYEQAQHDIARHQQALHDFDNQPSSEQQRNKLKKQKLDYAKGRRAPLSDYLSACQSAVEACERAVTGALCQLEVSVDVAVVADRVKQSESRTQELMDAVEAISDEISNLGALSRRQSAEVQNMLADKPHGMWGEIGRRLKDDERYSSPELVKAELAAVVADLELSVGINPGVVDQWRRLKAQLEEVTGLAENTGTALEAARHEITQIRSQFDPALEGLVEVVSSKFSAAFEKVGCQGEVKLYKDETHYDQWGIQIMVSYRDNESLSLLTAQHQSGGERSLATVTYLMSLSEMARTPFSLVDEINQGMDARAEKNVHNQLVEVTCNTDAGQYFLITPKLLQNLNYHPKMKVLVVNNGAYLPDSTKPDQRWGDLKGCLARYRRHHAIAAR